MKTLFTISLVFLLSPAAFSQAWLAYSPPFGDTIGIADMEVVSENVIWAMGARYGSNDTFYFNVPSAVWVARTVNGGASWSISQVDMGDIPFASSLTAVDSNTAFVTGLEFDLNTGAPQNAATFRTTNGGQTWSLSPVGWDAAASWPNFVHDLSPTKAFAFGDPLSDGEFEMYVTENGGDTWTRIPGAALPDPLPFEFGSVGAGDGIGNHIWYGTSAGRVLHSADAGATWAVGQTQLPYILGLSFSDALHGAAIAQLDAVTHLINHSSDGGATWTDITPSGINRVLGIEYIPNSPFILIGVTNGGAQSGPFSTWISPDRGATWQQISSGEIIGWPSFLNGSVGWAGEYQQFEHPTRLFKYTGSPLVGLFSPNKLDAEVTLAPNPASDVLRVNVQAQESGDFWILLNDAQGVLLQKEIVSEVSEFEKTLEIKNLPVGTYTLTIAGVKGSLTRKFIKQ